MEDQDIENKIEELYWKMREDHCDCGNPIAHFDVLFREAILFGQSRMRQRAIDCVPENPDPYGENAENLAEFQKFEGFNDCREQTLSALNDL